MLTLHYHATPNSTKVALLLEELGLPYEVVPVDIFAGAQHEPAFLAINPNAKVPALVDDGPDGRVVVFDSHAILLHLAEAHGRFMPRGRPERAAALSWLMLVATGLSPFSGQAIHFLHYAPEPVPYALNRYVREVERHYRVLDTRLAASPWLAGADYTIADMALFGWANSAGYITGERGLSEHPHLQAFVQRMTERPAVQRALALRERHAFKADLDEDARRAMFPQNEAA